MVVPAVSLLVSFLRRDEEVEVEVEDFIRLPPSEDFPVPEVSRELPGIISAFVHEKITVLPICLFRGCKDLVSVILREGLEKIEGGWKLNPASPYFGYEALGPFADCYSLSEIVLPEGLFYIGESAFIGCRSIASFLIPKSVTFIGDCAFHSCISLEEIRIPDGVAEIGEQSFYDCESLKSVVLGSGVTVIRSKAFEGCVSLTEIIIPEGVKEIRTRAFQGCTSLKTVVITGDTEIHRTAFEGCTSLSSIEDGNGNELNIATSLRS